MALWQKEPFTKKMADAAKGIGAGDLRTALKNMHRVLANPTYFDQPPVKPAKPGSDYWSMLKARDLLNKAYNPWLKSYQQDRPGKKVDVGHWVKEYWRWLSGGAKTSTVRPEKEMAAGQAGTQYLTDQGWRTYGQLDPNSTRAKYIADKMEAAELDTGDPQKYWENWKAPGGIDWTRNPTWTDIEGQPLWDDYKGMGWLPSNVNKPPNTPPPTPPMPITYPDGPPPLYPMGAGAPQSAYAATLAAGNPQQGAVTAALGRTPDGGANRVGNYATTGAGTTAKTLGTPRTLEYPEYSYTDPGYPGTTGYMQRVRDRKAKRIGRNISQAATPRYGGAGGYLRSSRKYGGY